MASDVCMNQSTSAGSAWMLCSSQDSAGPAVLPEAAGPTMATVSKAWSVKASIGPRR